MNIGTCPKFYSTETRPILFESSEKMGNRIKHKNYLTVSMPKHIQIKKNYVSLLNHSIVAKKEFKIGLRTCVPRKPKKECYLKVSNAQ